MSKIGIKKLLDGTLLIEGDFPQGSARATIMNETLTQQINAKYFQPYIARITAMVELMPPDSTITWRLGDNAVSVKGCLLNRRTP
jgi:hypothetical protein